MSNKLEGGGNGNGSNEENKIFKFPSRAARIGESAGYHRIKPTNQAPDGLEASVTHESIERSEQEYEEIALEIQETFENLIASVPRLAATEEEIEAKTALLLRETGDGTLVLEQYLNEAVATDVSQKRDSVILYLAAAKAYLDILELRRREGTPNI